MVRIAAMLLALAPLARADEEPKPKTFRMAVKPVVCRLVPDAKGLSGQELAEAVEKMGLQLHRSGYRMTALLPGDPPVACFETTSDPAKLPPGAR
jgi:hypothetical protein